MAKRSRNFSVLSFLVVGLVPLWLASCAGNEETGNPGSAGTTGAAGTSATGAAGTSATGAAGTSATGAAGTSATGAAGTSATGAAGTSATGAAGTSASGAAGTSVTGTAGTSATGAAGTSATGAAGTSAAAGTTGMGGRGGRGGTTGAAGTSAAAGTTGTAGATGGGGTTPCPAGTTTEFGCGPPRSMGYMGCSMSVNVATGYNRQGGMRMWRALSAYGGQVVQSWTPASGGPWSAFDGEVRTNGTPTDIWMMICIFSSQGVTAAEVQTMIRNARQHAPGARIWVTGQPVYNSGHTCTLAGASGPGLTDTRAKEANNPANNVFYAGTLILDASKGEVASDTCHASMTGENALGNQMIAKFGK